MRMIKQGRCNQLLDHGFSILTVGDNKQPNFPWKPLQTKPIEKLELERRLNFDTTKAVGIITGYNNVECLDIDLKVLEGLKAQQDFWKEFIGDLKDNIDDFDNKFVIYKTINNGYHIIYKCEEIGGNVKLAKLEGHNEAIIETRGKGGYIFVYDNKVGKLDYTEIKEISKDEREILFLVSKVYDYIDPTPESESIPKIQHPPEDRVSPWVDYNAKNNILDVIDDELKVVKSATKHYLVKRPGSTAAHSGYVYKNSNCLYLFSTGTIYPNERLLTPFACYAIKYYNGDFSIAAKEAYRDGYGDRIVKKKIEVPKVEIKLDKLDFPIDIFPESIQHYLIENKEKLSLSLDYMGCSLIWLISICTGNALSIEVKKGWIEKSPIWISLVGKAGIGKTPSINKVISPLKKANVKEIKKFEKLQKKFEAYSVLSKEEKKTSEEIKKPNKTQFIVNDITLEALVEMHAENKNAVGVFKDELAGWLKDFNKYRAGSDLEFWLSSWSGEAVNLNRKSVANSFLDKPFIPVLGGIQPKILEQFNNDDFRDSGFLDRLLICYPDLEVDYYNQGEIDYKLIEWFDALIIDFYNDIVDNVVQWDDEGEVSTIVCQFDKEAKAEWIKAFNNITELQNSDNESEFYKSMLPKQKSYIPRFALLIHTFNTFVEERTESFYLIKKDSVLKAIKLSQYFIEHAKKVKLDSMESKNLRGLMKDLSSPYDKFKAVYENDKDCNRAKLAEMLDISKRQVYNFIKKFNEST
jgi:hypothetical protein